MNKLIYILLFIPYLCISQSKTIEDGLNFFELSLNPAKNHTPDSSYFYAKESLKIFEQLKNDSLCLKAGIQLINLSDRLNKKEENQKYFEYTRDKAVSVKNWRQLSSSYLKKGNFHYNRFEDDKAMDYYLKSDSISTLYHLTDITVISNHMNIARLLMFAEKGDDPNFKKAEQYILKGMEVAEKQENDVGKAMTYEKYGDFLYRTKDHKRSLEYQRRALEIAKDQNLTVRESSVYWGIAANYLATKQMDSAEYYYKKRIEILESSDNNEDLALALSGLGSFYRRINRYDDAVNYLNQALKLFEEEKTNRTGQVLGTLNGLADAYYDNKNYLQAYTTLNRAYKLRDSVIQKTNQEKTLELETKYQTEKKEKEIALLNEQNKIALLEKRNQRFLFSAIIIAFILLGAFIFFSYRNKLKTAQKLKELDELKSRFFANISHEFRTPLTLIKSPLQILYNHIRDKSDEKHLLMIDQNVDRMLILVDQLLQLSKLESGAIKLIAKNEILLPFIISISDSFVYQAKQKNISFIENHILSKDERYWLDKDFLHKILSNLLSNAIKYTPQNGNIWFDTKAINDTLHISVCNDGVTLQQKDITKIFERFYQYNNETPGSGIGLALVKELVELYKGEISAVLKDQKLTFQVSLPLDFDTIKTISITEIAQENEFTSSKELSDTPNNSASDTPILLIVDDNADIRIVLKEIFKDYTIIEAKDGKEALNLAIKNVPDLIISDVMMPLSDGYELAQQIKANEITCNVPIILLTAITGDDAKIHSIESKADDFISKPFNHLILRKKAISLIEQRNKLRDRYSKELVLKPLDIPINTAEEKFIHRLQKLIDNHLSNPEFTADNFAKEIGMSRMQLHRKLRSLTGFSTTEFIRNERLKAAASILKHKNASVSETAYSVGFNDISYFSKCFKELFGTSPSEYQQNS